MPLRVVPIMKERANKKSSVSTRTVASLAAEPAKLRKKEMNARWPVDLFMKFVKIWGIRDIITTRK